MGEWKKVPSSEMAKWINCYNESGVVVSNKPCSVSITDAKNSFVVCSTLERSKHSARLLGIDNFISEPLFCVAELPVANIPLLKISPHSWSIIFRVLWFLGLSRNVESKKAALNRVKVASKMLENLAEEHENILLIGRWVSILYSKEYYLLVFSEKSVDELELLSVIICCKFR